MKFIDDTIKELKEVDRNSQLKAQKPHTSIPSRDLVVDIVKDVQAVLFPKFFSPVSVMSNEALLISIYGRIKSEIEAACSFADREDVDAGKISEEFISSLPSIKKLLLTDIEALYEGDPAAKYRDEVLICYPGFFAILVYRVAHSLYEKKIPIIPRMMTEFAHQKTGIDIHPGATIGEYFFIDHGTGIVIGETTVIGNHVKLYQGVTLGAKSFELDDNGNPVKDLKRHPNIGNNVIIYANATILGGDTYVGDNSIIGGNTWLIKSVPAGSKIYYE